MAELKDQIKSLLLRALNEKDEDKKEVENEDKRKIIDEVGGILKGKVDEEVWRTIIGKLEKLSYEPSEDNKVDNKRRHITELIRIFFFDKFLQTFAMPSTT